MVFSSALFLFLFLPLLLAAYFLPFRAGIRYKNSVLLLASLLFYAWGEPAFVFVMIAEIAWNWLCGRLLAAAPSPRRRRLWCALAIAVDIALLFVCKYLMFALRQVGVVPRWSIALPIGISFFTFQIISYVVDLYRGLVPVQRRIDDLALYVALFPQLVAGPIVRYADVQAAIASRRVSLGDFAAGIRRFLVGFAKKVLLANHMAIVADNLFYLSEAGIHLSAASAWIGAAAYALQIYFDFSGYSDMAIGLGRIFGFPFPENFRHPYMATTVTDFWRRWHISLSSWFRDYVYIPLGGNRRSPARNTFNLLVVWALTGFWHGANWTFLCWGLLYFCALMAERLLGIAKSSRHIFRPWALLVVLVCWVLFRASSLHAAAAFLRDMFASPAGLFDEMALTYLLGAGALMAVAILACTPILPALARRAAALRSPALRRLAACAGDAALAVLFLASALFVWNASYNPFIYFNF